MRSVLVLLLIPFLLVGNSLTHSHDSDTASSQRKGAHVHFDSNSHHHQHDHGSAAHKRPADSSKAGSSKAGSSHGHAHHHQHQLVADVAIPDHVVPVEHDSDAIYVVVSDFIFSASTNVCGLQHDIVTAAGIAHGLPPVMRLLLRRETGQGLLNDRLPLYLLHAALRL